VTKPSGPRRLERSDVREGFFSGALELDEWIVKFAWQNQRANNAVTYVTVADERVVGYYAITVAGCSKDAAPATLARAAPRQLPCILMARLAVDQEWQGRRIGQALLLDAIRRAVQISDSVGAAAFLIHCRDDAARQFYLTHGDFLPSPVDPLHLFAPMKDLRKEFPVSTPGL